MKTVVLVALPCILLAWYLLPDLCRDAAHYLQEMIFYSCRHFYESVILG